MTVHGGESCTHHLPVCGWLLILSILPSASSPGPSVLWQGGQNAVSLCGIQAEVSMRKLPEPQTTKFSFNSHTAISPQCTHMLSRGSFQCQSDHRALQDCSSLERLFLM